MQTKARNFAVPINDRTIHKKLEEAIFDESLSCFVKLITFIVKLLQWRGSESMECDE